MGDWLDVWMSLNFFQITTPPTVLSDSHETLTHVIYVPICKKTMEQIFEILVWKFLADF